MCLVCKNLPFKLNEMGDVFYLKYITVNYLRCSGEYKTRNLMYASVNNSSQVHNIFPIQEFLVM